MAVVISGKELSTNLKLNMKNEVLNFSKTSFFSQPPKQNSMQNIVKTDKIFFIFISWKTQNF